MLKNTPHCNNPGNSRRYFFKKISIILVITIIIQCLSGYSILQAEENIYSDRFTDIQAPVEETSNSNTETDTKIFSDLSIDSTAPSVPTNMTVVSVSGSAITVNSMVHKDDTFITVSGPAITLVWDASTDNQGVQGYKIYCNDIYIDMTSNTYYSFTNLAIESVYKFYVSAFDKSGNESLFSNNIILFTNISVIKNDIQPPTTPNNIIMIPISTTSMRLIWDASSDNIALEGYEVYCNGKSIGFTRETSFIDYEFDSQAKNMYSIAAFDLSGNKSQEGNAVYVDNLDEAENPYEYKTDRFIVKYKKEAGSFKLNQYLKNSTKGKQSLKNKNTEVIILDKKVKPKDFIYELKGVRSNNDNGNKKSEGVEFDFESDIEYIQPDYPFMAMSLDPLYEQQWGLKNVESVVTAQTTDEYKGITTDELMDESDSIEKYPVIDDITGIETDNSIINNDTNKSSIIGADVEEAWPMAKGAGSVIAVLDTGVDISHEDLRDNIWINQGEIPDNGIDDDGNGFIDDVNGWNFVDQNNQIHNPYEINDEWHGTHITGIIAAQKDNNLGITGVAPEAKVMPLKVFKNGTAYTSDIIAAIEYAEIMGVKIINCSWGSTEENPALKETIENSNMLFVCSSGNGHINIDIKPVYPASYDNYNIITVASIGSNGILSGFSNYGENSVDVAAPGEDIISTTPGNEYIVTSGTSMATAFVSGEAALLLSLGNGLNISEIKDRIISSSDRLSTLDGKILEGNKINYQNAVINVFSDTVIQIDAIDYNDYSSGVYTEQRGYTLYGSGTWTTKANLPISADGIKAVALNGKIYAVGGYLGNHIYSKALYEYNPITDIWTRKADMLTDSNIGAAVVANEKLYVMAGDGISSFASKIYEYNPLTDTWTVKTTMPTARSCFSTAVVNNVIYIMTGCGSNYYNTVEAYNILANTWSTKASMPGILLSSSAVVINGNIYVTGAYNSNRVYMYNPQTNSWTVKPSMSSIRSEAGVAALGCYLYAIGGYEQSSGGESIRLNTVEEYSICTQSWTPGPNMNTSLVRCGSAVLNDTIYVIGGSNGGLYLNSVLCYTPIKSDDSINDYGNTMSTAKQITEESITSGVINNIGDEDYFKMTALYNIYYDIDVSGSIYPLIDVYNSAGTLLCSGLTRTGNTFQSGQTYYIRIRNNNNLTGIYELKLVKSLSRPANIYIISNANSITVSWDMVNYATLYEIIIDEQEIFSSGSNLSYTHLNPSANVAHSYRIRAKINLNESYWSESNWSYPILGATQGGNWSLGSNMPSPPRSDLGVTSLNGKVYAIGGNYSEVLTNVSVYDFALNSWTSKAGLPIPRYGLGVVTVNNKVYAIGGINGSYSYTNLVDEYDPSTNVWTSKAVMPTARSNFGITVMNDKIYVVGGYNGSSYLNTVEEYNPTTNSWTTKAPMPIAVKDLSATSLNNKLYAIGGYNGQQFLNNTLVYDPLLNTWSAKANLNYARKGLGSCVINQKIYAIGGFSSSDGYLNVIEVYDPGTNQWKVDGYKLIKSEMFGITTLNGKIVIIGGFNPNYNKLSTVEIKDVSYQEIEYIYDINGRLKEKRNRGITVALFDYDKNGNLISVQSMQ